MANDQQAGLRLPVRLTLAEAPATLNELDRATGLGGSEVWLDAGDLQTFDSSAVAVLLELRRKLLGQGKALRVCNWPERLRELVDIYGVSDLLPADGVGSRA